MQYIRRTLALKKFDGSLSSSEVLRLYKRVTTINIYTTTPITTTSDVGEINNGNNNHDNVKSSTGSSQYNALNDKHNTQIHDEHEHEHKHEKMWKDSNIKI